MKTDQDKSGPIVKPILIVATVMLVGLVAINKSSITVDRIEPTPDAAGAVVDGFLMLLPWVSIGLVVLLASSMVAGWPIASAQMRR